MRLKDRIYADHAASSPMSESVLETLMKVSRDVCGNPSSVHSHGSEAEKYLRNARESAAELIGAYPDEIYFTSGGTEADNWAILSGHGGGVVVTSDIEHPAVMMSVRRLTEHGVKTAYFPTDSCGRAVGIAETVCEGTSLVSLMYANNETGVIQNVREAADRAHEAGALFHCDAVQAAGHIPIDVHSLGVDMMSVSGHKLGAPKGVGFLCIRRGVSIDPLIVGGGQESGMRSGTVPVPLIAAFGEACAEAIGRMDAEYVRVSSMRDRLERELLKIDGAHLNGEANRLPGITNISFDGVGGEELALMCDLRGAEISAGSACHAGKREPSPVISAMGLGVNRASEAVRISLGIANDESDILRICGILSECVGLIRGC